MTNLLAYTKKLSEQIAYYDTLVKQSFAINPFTKPIEITIVWIENINDKEQP